MKMVEFNGVLIPTFEWLYPSLLFWKLGELIVDQLKSLCLNKELAILIGTSGSGKTRQTFEVLCSIYGIYFTLTDGKNPGSSDLTKMLKRLENHMDRSNLNSNQDYLTRLIKCIVLSRLSLFKQCYELTSITPRDWLLIQLRFDCTPILNEARKLTEKDLESKLKELTLYMQQKNECNGSVGYLPIFLDEAQATMYMYSDFFYSTNDDQNKAIILRIK